MILEIEGYRYEIDEENLSPRDYGTLKESGKQAVKFIWLEEYVCRQKDYLCERHCHLLECSARGTITFDGKKINSKEASMFFKSKIFGKYNSINNPVVKSLLVFSFIRGDC